MNYKIKVSKEIYDKKVSPILEEIKHQENRKQGKYSFIMTGNDGEKVYVIPSRLGQPNDTENVNIFVENSTLKLKKSLRSLLN